MNGDNDPTGHEYKLPLREQVEISQVMAEANHIGAQYDQYEAIDTFVKEECPELASESMLYLVVPGLPGGNNDYY